MKPLKLDFSSYQQQLRKTIGLIIASLLLLLLVSLIVQHRNLLQGISQKQALLQMQEQQPAVKLTPGELQLSEEKTATEIEQALNLPWLTLLTTLEQVQKQQSNVLLTALQPNPGKSEVTITGIAADFATLMAYIKTLGQQPVFTEVLLTNQRQTDENGKQELAFTLSAKWKT